MVPALRLGHVARLEGPDQGDHVLGHDVAHDRDHAAAADRHQRQRQAVVAAEDGQVGGGDDLRGLVHRAGGLLDHGDVGQLGHADDGLRLDVLAGAAGDVVDADGDVDRLGQDLEVLIEAFLGRLVVVGGDDQGGVGPGLGGPAGQPQGLLGAVRAGAGHDLDPPGGRLDHGRDHPLVLRVRERGALAGRAHRADARRAGLDLELHLPLQGLDIDLAVAERRDHGHRQAGKLFTAGWHGIWLSVVSGQVS